jgi:glutaredoxin
MGYKLELYYYDYCPFCVRVVQTIKELGIKVTFCNTMDNPNLAKKLYKDTGRQTVPCLYINDKPMHESNDIIKWLKEKQTELDKK